MKFPNPLKVSAIAELLNGKIAGNPDKVINGINRIEDVAFDDLTFIADDKYTHFLDVVTPGCVLTSKKFRYNDFPSVTFILVDNPRIALDFVLRKIDEQRKHRYSSFVSTTAVIGENCKIAKTAYIGANAVIGNDVTIGEHTVIMPGVIIYDDVTIGNHTTINANVTVYQEVEIGNNCIIHAGAVIGSDGFGFEEQKDGSWVKIPQLGNVKVGDNVEIGANTTIDRALLGSTEIENGVKLDNLIHVAHNVHLGENTACAAQVGFAGSSKIGKRNRMGGQVGVAGHLTTADDVIIMAQSGIAKSVNKSGAYFGSPAKEQFLAFKIEAVINNLPELRMRVRELEKIIEKNKNESGI